MAFAVRVWDIGVRLFHWLLVASIGLSWWSAETGRLDLHRLFGGVGLALMVFRILWGFFGSQTARFSNFVRKPRSVIDYARGLFQGHYAPSIGHSPLGGWSTMLLLAVISLQILSGLFSVDLDGLESGPFAFIIDFEVGREIAHFHRLNFNILFFLIAIHIAAIFIYYFLFKDNLAKPMITGSKILNKKREYITLNKTSLALCVIISTAIPVSLFFFI